MSSKPQGSEKYIPTRLEWIVLQLNAGFDLDDLKNNRFILFYTEGENEESVCISVIYDDDVNKEFMDERIEKAKEIVLNVAKVYGWDSWLEVEVDVKKF